MEFDWDEGNRDKNWVAHAVTREESEECFFNLSLQFDDIKHSQKEPRHVLLGTTDQERILTVVYTLRGERIRIISARPMSREERKLYETYKEKKSPLLQK